MSYYNIVPVEDRYAKIIQVLKDSKEYLTASQICRKYVGDYTTSDVGSTGQILKILSLAGYVERKVDSVPGRRKQIITYKLVKQ